MNCNECTNKRSVGPGCNGNSCGPCVAEGNNSLTVFDWLSGVAPAMGQPEFDCYEIRFKNGRKVFFRNVNELKIRIGDVVAVEASPGHDIGVISAAGDLARIQMRRKGIDSKDPEIRKIYRRAFQRDIDTWQLAISRENTTLVKTREILLRLDLDMKLCDVEYQGDNLKATFYYTAEGRVDFRQLIKELASEFSIRVEMRQIGLRQEAARVGGIGSCGRELCCVTWLTDFRSVNTSAARYQRLSLNPQKLAGQCGKLKCCLNFELDVYVDAVRDFPDTDRPLYTEKGNAVFQKMDIFKREFWYAYESEFMTWLKLSVDAVRQIQRINASGKKIASIEEFAAATQAPSKGGRSEEKSVEMSAVEGDDLTRFDRKGPSRDRDGRDNRGRGGNDQRRNGGREGQRDQRPRGQGEPSERDRREGANATQNNQSQRPSNGENRGNGQQGGQNQPRPSRDNRNNDNRGRAGNDQRRNEGREGQRDQRPRPQGNAPRNPGEGRFPQRRGDGGQPNGTSDDRNKNNNKPE